jgi:hypothetical protein
LKVETATWSAKSTRSARMDESCSASTMGGMAPGPGRQSTLLGGSSPSICMTISQHKLNLTMRMRSWTLGLRLLNSLIDISINRI